MAPSKPPQQRRSRRWTWSLLTIVLILVAGAFGWMLGRQSSRQSGQQSAVLHVYGPAPVYQGFVNQLGQKVDSREFKGKLRLVTFLFPYCTSYCPLIALHLTGLETELRQAGLQSKVQIVAFNVDPSHTGPQQERAFLKEYGWNPSDLHWQFLSASSAKTRQVVRNGYHISYEQVSEAQEKADATQQKAHGVYKPQPEVANALAARVKPDYDIAHNDALVLVDAEGNMRWINLQADRVSDGRLMKLIRSLLAGG